MIPTGITTLIFCIDAYSFLMTTNCRQNAFCTTLQTTRLNRERPWAAHRRDSRGSACTAATLLALRGAVLCACRDTVWSLAKTADLSNPPSAAYRCNQLVLTHRC